MNQITKVTQLPAKNVAKPYRYRAFDDFANEAGRLASQYRLLEKAAQNVYSHCSSEALKHAEYLLAEYDRRDRERAERLDLAQREFEPDEAYDEDGMTRSQVAKHVSLLIGSFPNANPGDPETYTKMLIEEIMAAVVSVVSLETACRNIRRSAKFLPTISEVLEAIKEANSLWSKRWEAIECFEEAAEELRTKLTAEKDRRAQQEIQREKRKLAPPAFTVGDRVEHQKFGRGTVSEVDGNKYTVKFDGLDEPKKMVAEFIEHAITTT
jgi:hypothetical protein